jgi:hypothetical protein
MLRFRPLRGINTIGRTLKKTPKRYPGLQGVIPPETNSALVAAMEDVLAAPGRASTIRIVAWSAWTSCPSNSSLSVYPQTS